MLPASQPSPVLNLSLKPFLLQGLLDWCAGMKLTPILVAAPHPDRQLPQRIAQFPDFLAFNMSPRAIGDLVIGPTGLRFVTRLAGGEAIERVVLPLGSWHSVRVRETQHQFSLAFSEVLGGPVALKTTSEPPTPGRASEVPLWWPDGLALMATEPSAAGAGHTDDKPSGLASSGGATEQPPAWEGLISATQADRMRGTQEIGGPGRRTQALSTAQQRWGGAGLVTANQEAEAGGGTHSST